MWCTFQVPPPWERSSEAGSRHLHFHKDFRCLWPCQKGSNTPLGIPLSKKLMYHFRFQCARRCMDRKLHVLLSRCIAQLGSQPSTHQCKSARLGTGFGSHGEWQEPLWVCCNFQRAHSAELDFLGGSTCPQLHTPTQTPLVCPLGSNTLRDKGLSTGRPQPQQSRTFHQHKPQSKSSQRSLQSPNAPRGSLYSHRAPRSLSSLGTCL